ncbi:MAG: OmpH family outer membrane protein [Bacteroidetes bacterium]|nr:MAG: OmpH family outer membrane protein [Bacteroidota bacterium]
MKRLGILITVILMSATMGMAQKYGHLNFGNLLSSMPETKAADANLESYQKQLVAKGEKMATDFQTKVNNYVNNAQTMSPVQARETEEALEKERQSILAYEQEVIQKVNNKRAELLQPIVEKAEKAIADVAKEQGYTMIFDSSIFNALLYAGEAEDVMPFVAAKLGL